MQASNRRVITSRSEFHEALRGAFSLAASVGARELWLCDEDFADWPLGERAVVDELNQWAQSRRRLTVLAHSFDEVARRHGRWTEWRRQWAHVVECRTNGEIEAAQMPTICLVSDIFSVRLSDPVRHRGMASHEAADALACREAIDAVSQRSIETFPATTLGL
jgi:hypothetical protein